MKQHRAELVVGTGLYSTIDINLGIAFMTGFIVGGVFFYLVKNK